MVRLVRNVLPLQYVIQKTNLSRPRIRQKHAFKNPQSQNRNIHFVYHVNSPLGIFGPIQRWVHPTCVTIGVYAWVSNTQPGIRGVYVNSSIVDERTLVRTSPLQG